MIEIPELKKIIERTQKDVSKQQLLELIKEVDYNQDGWTKAGLCSRKLLDQFYELLAHFRNLEEQIYRHSNFNSTACISQDGKINFSEFLSATIDINKFLTEKRLQAIFHLFDTTNTGMINSSDIQ